MARSRAKTVPLPVTPAEMTVEEACEAFLGRDLSRNTCRNFRSDLRRFCRAFGRRPVSSIAPQEIRDYLDGLTTRTDEPVSAETHNQHFGTLGNLFSWLVRQGEAVTNPMAPQAAPWPSLRPTSRPPLA